MKSVFIIVISFFLLGDSLLFAQEYDYLSFPATTHSDFDSYLEPVHSCSESTPSSKSSARTNLDNHTCSSSVTSRPLRDFFAYTCSCPTPGKRLSTVRSIGEKYEQMYDRYTSSGYFVSQLTMNEEEKQRCLNDFPEYISPRNQENIFSGCQEGGSLSPESNECRYVQRFSSCMNGRDGYSDSEECQLFAKCSIYKKNKNDFRARCNNCVRRVGQSEQARPFSWCLQKLASIGSSGVQVPKSELMEVLSEVGWEPAPPDPTTGFIIREPWIPKEQLQKVCGAGARLWPVSDEVNSLMSDYDSKMIRPALPMSLRDATISPGYGFEARDVNSEIFYALKNISGVAVEKLYEVEGENPDAGVNRVASVFDEAKTATESFVKKKLSGRLEDCSEDCDFGDRQCTSRVISCGSKNQTRSLAIEKIMTKIRDIKITKCQGANMAKMANGAYNRDKNEICFAAPYMEMAQHYPESLKRFLFHELGHAVHYELRKSPIFNEEDESSLASCLRSPTSVEALLIEAQGTRRTPGYKPKVDQIGESFSDWFAIELLSNEIGKTSGPKEKYRNVGLTLCESGALEGSEFALTDPHPTGPDRINKIIAAHPTVRSAFGRDPLTVDSTPLRYCPSPEVW